MKNNRLIITQTSNVKANLYKTSLRVKTLDRASEIVKSRNKNFINAACFKDAEGNYFEHNGLIFKQAGEPIIQ